MYMFDLCSISYAVVNDLCSLALKFIPANFAWNGLIPAFYCRYKNLLFSWNFKNYVNDHFLLNGGGVEQYVAENESHQKSPPSPLFGQPLLWTGKKKVSLSSPRNTQTAKLIKQKSIKKKFPTNNRDTERHVISSRTVSSSDQERNFKKVGQNRNFFLLIPE